MLAGQLDGVIGVDDGPGVNDVDRRLERVDAFQKERAFLVIEDREPLIDGQHELIGFDLREIRVRRERRIHRRREAEIQRDAGFRIDIAFSKAGRSCRAGLGGHAGRDDFERPAFADIGELSELTGLVEQARSIA